MTNKWKQQIDEQLGPKKWNKQLSSAIQQQAARLDDTPQKAPSFIPFISMAMLTVLILLTLSVWPLQPQNGEQASETELKFKEVYYSKLPAQSYDFHATDNLFSIGMEKTNDALLLEQFSIAYEQKKEIDTLSLEHSKKMDIILFDEVGIQYRYQIHETFTGELIFEEPESYVFYKYSGPETALIFDLIDKEFPLKTFIIFAAIILVIALVSPYIVYKYYGVKKRKETFNHITLNRLSRWLPVPYLFYVNVKLAFGPEKLTWWEIIIPFLLYQFAVLCLMKQQKEPHPYIVERMINFIIGLVLLIGFMILV